MQKLEADFYRRDTTLVARELLGKRLTHVVDGMQLSVRITETEAYLGAEDKACHSYGWRRTPRTSVMYRPGGCAYVYLIYGMYHMLNAVTDQEEIPCAVLIRAGEPVEECRDAIAGRRFGKTFAELSSYQRKNLLNGPGKLCRALGIDGNQNGVDLTGDMLYMSADTMPYPFIIGTSKRIGIDYAEEAADWPLRFTVEKDNR